MGADREEQLLPAKGTGRQELGRFLEQRLEIVAGTQVLAFQS